MARATVTLRAAPRQRGALRDARREKSTYGAARARRRDVDMSGAAKAYEEESSALARAQDGDMRRRSAVAP